MFLNLALIVCTLVFLLSGTSFAKESKSKFPMLVMDGFSWAENLAFDGLGGLFVSEAVQAKLYRICYNPVSSTYERNVHLAKGFKQFGGLAPTPDGQMYYKTIYAAVIFQDKTFGIISTSTKASINPLEEQAYTILTNSMDHLANGMQLVPKENAIYGTSETGTLTRVSTIDGSIKVISDTLVKPDGLWYDTASNLLLVGELVTKRLIIYDLNTQKFSNYYPAVSSLPSYHMIDDLTVVAANGITDTSNLNSTYVVAADWTGKTIVKFTLDGKDIQKIAPPADIDSYYEPTSIRRGKGFGFDPNSFYITEGGGATRYNKFRRIIQLTPGAI